MKSQVKKLDKIVGDLIRGRGKCEKCGRRDKLQWCHIVGRSAKRIKWDLDNAVCLCQLCHFRFTNHFHEFYAFIGEKHGEDHYSNLMRRANDFSYKINHEEILERLKG